MPPRRAVELRVGGQTYRVVATDNDQNVQRLADLVDRKFAEVVPQGRASVTAQQAMFLTAMALAAELTARSKELDEARSRASRLEAERDNSVQLASRAKEVVARVLERVDTALSSTAGGSVKSNVEPAPAPAEGFSAEDIEELPAIAPASPTDGDGASEEPPDAIDALLRELMPPALRNTPSAQNTPARADGRHPASAPSEPENRGDATVGRHPRGGLRLVRQTTKGNDDSR